MGQSTQGYVNRNVTAMDIYNVICEKYDKETGFDIKTQIYNEEEQEIGSIFFKDGEDQRRLFICYGEVDKEDIFNKEIEFNGSKKYVYLSFGFWGNSVQIMTDIIKCFGGYIKENDCDEMPIVYIPQSENFNYQEYIQKRNAIAGILDVGLSYSLKIQIASQILKYKEELKIIL
jgi:hypothetical protein